MSDRRRLAPRELLDRLRAAGADGLQLREKDLADGRLLALAESCAGRAGGSVAVLVNGRADVALAAGCDGVHLPADAPPTGPLRRRFGTDLLIGRSTHRAEEVARERDAGADYVTFGPVYPTPGKAAMGPPPGLAGLRRAVATGLPVLALGGVDAGRLEELAAAGAWGVAGIRAFHDPTELARLASTARRLWPASQGGGPPHTPCPS